MQKYKLQPGKNEPVDRRELRRVILQVLYNQFVISFLVSIICFSLVMFFGLGSPEKIRGVPELHIFIIHFFGCMVVREIIFYYSHRLMHMPSFYERYHKKHHQWTAPIAVSAQYADVVEHMFSNLAPVMIPLAIFNCHLVTVLIYYTHVHLRTLSDHSGYRFPYYYNSERHDKHHEV